MDVTDITSWTSTVHLNCGGVRERDGCGLGEDKETSEWSAVVTQWCQRCVCSGVVYTSSLIRFPILKEQSIHTLYTHKYHILFSITVLTSDIFSFFVFNLVVYIWSGLVYWSVLTIRLLCVVCSVCCDTKIKKKACRYDEVLGASLVIVCLPDILAAMSWY